MINNKSTMSIQPNGNNVPVWKLLGYASYQDYINASSGANGNKGIVSPWKGTQAPVSVYDGIKAPSLKTPSLDRYANFIGAGGGAPGGVTKEGVIIGNPNVNNDTFNKTASRKPSTVESVIPKTPSVPQNPSTPTTATTEKTPTEQTPPAPTRTDEGSYNGTSNFLEWYKENYGVDYDPSVGFSRREGMNDGVWNVGTNLYNYYLQGLDDERKKAEDEANRNKYYDEQLETLLGEYSASREALDKSKRQSQQNASITLDKLKKYLPTQIKSQGLGGLGVSESTMLQAYNNYNNDMGAIESDYQANKTSLDTGETAAKNTLENYRQDALKAIADKYNAAADARQAEAGQTSGGIFSAYETQVKAQLESRRQEIQSMIEQSTATSIDELMGYIKELNGKIDETAYNNLVNSAQQKIKENTRLQQMRDKESAVEAVKDGLARFDVYEDWEGALKYLEQNKSVLGEQEYNPLLSQYTGWAEKAKTDKETADKEEKEAKDKRIITGQESFEYGGKYYQINSRLDNNANEIKRNDDFTKKLKELGFTDPFDANIPNGTTITISCDSSGSNKVDYKDFFLMDLSDWRNWIPGYNLYNQVNNWANLDSRTMTYYNGQWYLSTEVGK